VSVRPMTMWTVDCDRCGSSVDDSGEYVAWRTREQAETVALDTDWKIVDQADTGVAHFCPSCWTAITDEEP